VRKNFERNGYSFRQGLHAILDLYGTNHDARLWERPEEFSPERFRQWNGSAFNFIPQGGGDHHTGHRCPGEWITIELMKVAIEFLSRSMRYQVPKQDLRVSLSHMPTMPKSQFLITHVKRG
jgi:fatty-acid peroxygenase